MLRIEDPFIYEISRNIAQPQTKEIIHLGTENGQGYTGSETYNDGVGNELNDRTETRQAHGYQQDTRHDGSDHQPGESVLLNDTVYDDDERTRRTAYLHFAAAENGD